MRILFAEDDRDIAKAVQTLLERSGYSVDVVFNGQDAFDYIETGGSGAKSVRLNNKAFQLMEMLVDHKGAVLSISQIMERIWGWDCESEINVVWVNISFLRKKLSELGAHANIKAVRGVGYTLENTL